MTEAVVEMFLLLEYEGGFFIAIVFALLIAGFLSYLLFLVYCVNSYWWTRTDGMITVSKMHRSKQTTSGSHSTTMFKPIVEYEYEVAGKRYKKRKVRFFQLSTSSRSAAQKTLVTFPQGAVVAVYYNSRIPSSSVLIRGLSFGAVFMLFFFLLSIWLLTFTVQ